MANRPLVIMICICVCLLSGCTGFSINQFLPSSDQGSPTKDVTPEPQSPTLIPSTETPQATPGPSQIITIWFPPIFNPNDGSKTGVMMKERLDKFLEENPGVQIKIRVKNTTGPGGLLDTLSTASASAPLALPSLIFLPRSDLENAALKGLIYPIDSYLKPDNPPDWFPYSQQLPIIQDNTFGLPFIGDAIVMLYRPEKIGSPPPNWNQVFRFGQVVLFPAADPQALFTLSLYQSIGGPLKNDLGQPSLDPEQLKKVFSFYVNGAQQGIFPFWLSQYETDEQTLQAYKDKRANIMLTWISNYLKALPADTIAMPVPPFDTQEYTSANGWVLALSDPSIEHRALSMRLAEFLVQSDFLGQWTAAAGYLPTRPSELPAWNNKSIQNLVNQVALNAVILPTNDVMSSISPVLQEATIQVIKLQSDPSQAAKNAAEKLTSPQPIK